MAADDQVVSDTSFFDFGFLGQIGAVPGWPGVDAYPPQPMKTQVRTVLERYKANGGEYREAQLAECGHSPHIEKHDRGATTLHKLYRYSLSKTGVGNPTPVNFMKFLKH